MDKTLLRIAGCIGLLLSYVAIKVIYNAFFHPFSKIPGPALARVTRVWSRIANLDGRKSELIHAAHQKYGPVVRVAPNEISFADPKVLREIYTSEVFVKEDSFYFAKRIFHEDHLFSTRNVEAHKQRRKLFSRGYSQATMNEFEPNIDAKLNSLFDQLIRRAEKGQAINVQPWIFWLSFDTVYHLLFGSDPATLTSGSESQLLTYFRAWRPTFIYKEFIPQLDKLGVNIPGKVGGYFRHVNEWKKQSVALIKQSREENIVTPFFRSVLYGEKDTYLGRPLTDSELAEECMGGMFGGTGTTASTFIYLLWATLGRPEVVAQLKAELKEAFPDRDAVPEHKMCAKLPYLQAVINETLRLYPTIIATMPRTASQQAQIGGIVIPKGGVVGIQNYTILRNEQAFPEPEKFRPERWLEKSENQALMDEAFQPFSIGTRRCIGINLAQMELNKLTAAWFRRIDAWIDPSMTAEDMRMFDAFSAGPAGGKLLLHLKKSVD